MLTPPTDSLYKFMAVFGLVLIVTGYVMDYQARRALYEALESQAVEGIKVVNEVRADSDRTQQLLRQLKNYDPKTAEGAKQQQRILDEMAAPALNKSAEDYFSHSASYVKAEKVYELAKKEYDEGIHRITSLTIGGAILALAGFSLWYLKVQRYIDKQLAGPNPSANH